MNKMSKPSSLTLDPANLQRVLASDYPELLVQESEDGKIVVQGTYPIVFEGQVRDRFQIRMEIAAPLSEEVPTVWEVGGRVPRTADDHTFTDGSLCVEVPEIWLVRPTQDKTLVKFLEGPLRNFFLGHIAVELGEEWPFGERSHGSKGLLEAYQQMLGVDDPLSVIRFLRYLAKDAIKGHLDCFCGSGEIIRRCHLNHVRNLQGTVRPQTAQQALERIARHVDSEQR